MRLCLVGSLRLTREGIQIMAGKSDPPVCRIVLKRQVQTAGVFLNC